MKHLPNYIGLIVALVTLTFLSSCSSAGLDSPQVKGIDLTNIRDIGIEQARAEYGGYLVIPDNWATLDAWCVANHSKTSYSVGSVPAEDLALCFNPRTVGAKRGDRICNYRFPGYVMETTTSNLILYCSPPKTET